LPIEKRGVFLVRFVAQLQLRGSHFTTDDLDDAVRYGASRVDVKSSRGLVVVVQIVKGAVF
jgi:hypothetical protein